MSVLVTGGAGFIGSTLVDQLVAGGHEVVVVDDLSTGSEANLADAMESGLVSLEVCDISQPAVSDLIADVSPGVIMHLAAQADVQASIDDPVRDAEVNVVGTIRVLEGARRAGTRKVVLATSGGTLYGDPDPSHLPYTEVEPHAPMSPYGLSKKAAGDYLAAYGPLHGMAHTTLALANVYGPRQDPHGEAGVVAIFARCLLAGEACTVYGDGRQTRDFVHVADAARAFVAAMERGDDWLLNIGTGIETSVNHLYSVMATAADGPVEPQRAQERPGEVRRSALDASAAAATLGWEPSLGLADGVADTLAWFDRG